MFKDEVKTLNQIKKSKNHRVGTKNVLPPMKLAFGHKKRQMKSYNRGDESS